MPGTFVSIPRHGPKGQTSVRDKVDTPIPVMSGSDVRKELKAHKHENQEDQSYLPTNWLRG
jgi:hypothetical protein